MRVPFAFLGAGAVAAFDPATLALSGWWRASYAGSPWVAVASAGGSGANGSLTEATNPPATGAAVNGLTSADCDGTNDQLRAATSVATFLTNAAGSIASLFYADTAAADPTTALYYDAPALFSDDTSGQLALAFSAGGVYLGCSNGVNFNAVSVACATGGWHLAQGRWNGTDIEVRIDSGAWQTLSRTVSLSADNIRVGANYAAAAFFDGKILETMTATTRLADDDFNDIKSYVNTRYALAL